MAKVKDIAMQIRGVSYHPEDLHDNLDEDSVVLLRANNIKDGKLILDDVVYVSKSKVAEQQYLQTGDILICASSGSKELVGKAAFVDSVKNPMTFGAFCKVVRPQPEYSEYLGHYFNSPVYRRKISALSAGANINNIKNEHIDNLDIQLVDEKERREIITILNELNMLIFLRKQQLSKLDELVKARFVEMFGDPSDNVNNLPASQMTAICQIIDGDRGKNYPKQEEFSDSGFCLFLNAKNVTAQGFSFENCTYITEEKDALLRNGKLCRGDVVLTTRGTIGNLAFYDTSVPYENIRINSGMVILRMNKQVVSEIFFIEQFKMQLDSIKSRIASGSAQPQLPISTMNKIEMILPPIELQNQFAAFVERIDQQKQTVQQSLEKLELVKKALMQEYFG